MDTVRIARRRFGRGGNGLQQLAPRLGYQPTTAHRALADAQTTAFVFEKLMEPVGGWDLCLCDAIAAAGRSDGADAGQPARKPAAAGAGRGAGAAPAGDDGVPRRARQNRTRVIEPLHVRRSGGELLLIAYCQLA